MTSRKGLYVGSLILLACSIFVFGFKSSFAKQSGATKAAKDTAENAPQGQSLSIERLSAPAKPTSEAVTRSMANARFAPAALRNAQLQTDLNWVFGGKSQRGWQLYTPLISSIIGAQTDVETDDFAASLSQWQKENGVEATGVLESATWSQMISNLQSNRIKDRTYPTADQLVTIPTSECYDPSRAEELRKVERRTYEAYKRMIAAAASDPSLGLSVTGDGSLSPNEKYLKVISAFRSREYQEHLRQQSPNSGRAGLAVNSPHFTGRALDLYVGGEPVSTKDENRASQTRTKAYRWLVKNAGRFGFQPYFYEPWHWEFVGK
ncbi:MAG TPA: D-alanyl-D-alanine carboxypeptidase family protein [Blastocatellia bacterium]|nr:D-alanyl-D-alanine carboxypeptidase family protein [Blastocatellia bacterium]